jgi:DoxX-like family
MQSTTQTASVSKARLWTGRTLSALAVLFLLFDGVIKLMNIAPVAESFTRLGYPVSVARGIGILELICLVIYLIPRTSALGAVLLTGFLGGAIATHVRVGDPLFSHVLFPTYIGLLIWGGLFLREGRLRALVPLRSEPAPASRPPARESVLRTELAEQRS